MIVPPAQPNPEDEHENQEFDENDEAEWGGEDEAPTEASPNEPSPSEQIVGARHLRHFESSEEDEIGGEDDLITIATFRTAPEAELVKTALDAEGITAFIADAETVTMDWLLGVAIGDVKLQVARRDKYQARAFLAERSKARADNERESHATCLSCGAPFPEDANKCPQCGWTFE